MYNEEQFYKDLEEYLNLYDKGLKKHANKLMFESMKNFDTLDLETKQHIALSICEDCCDANQIFSDLLLRGNGSMPFELSNRVKPILESFCQQNLMPQMRWYYQLYSDAEVLGKAYEHLDCDEKTVELYFNTMINHLYWGAHHFPEGCLITYESYKKTVEKGKEILDKHHDVPQNLQEEFQYYMELYEIWWEYTASDKAKGFYEMCDERKLGFEPVITVYYDK